MDNIFPETPYIFNITTTTGECSLEFPATQWHEPVKNVALLGNDLAIKDMQQYFQAHNIGMWGYPIESLDFCSPMDVHANLTTNQKYNHDDLIKDFM